MTSRAYPAAASVASRVEAHFARHAAESPEARAVVPDAAAVEAIVSAGFWASLRREEGYDPKISLAYLPPERAGAVMLFARSLPLEASALAKVSPAVERPGIHLGVWRIGGELRVWGATRVVPPFCMVLEVAAPGLLVVKHRREGDGGKFVNVAVLEGEAAKFVDEEASTVPDCPALLTTLLGLGAPATWSESTNALVDLAVSMRAHGRGGALLVVPHGSDAWRESVVKPLAYAVSPPYDELAALMRAGEEDRGRDWRDATARAIETIAGLTAVDGAAVITTEYDLVAFGVKITRRDASSRVGRVLVTEPIEGNEAMEVEPVQLGGTRHLSAAQFAYDQRDALALVASQDGRFTIFAWSSCDEIVHAHRIESLLL